jgi:NitT/TauT family transport system substrate-binding protein
MNIHKIIFELLAKEDEVSRRDFLKISGTAGAALALSGVATTSWAKVPLAYGHLAAAQVHEPVPMILKEKGILAKEGFDAKFSEYLAGAFAMQHFTGGEIDFVNCGVPPMLIARGAGTDIVILASSNTEGSRIIALPEIKRVEDLAGKKVGTPGLGSIQDALLTMVEKKFKMKVPHVPIKVSDMPIYLQKKEISAFIAWEPHCANTVHLGYGHSIYTSRDIFPGHQCCALGVQGKLIRERPDMVEKVTKVYLDTFQYFNAHKEEMIKLMSEKTLMPIKVMKEAVEFCGYPNPPYVNVESLKIFTRELIDAKKIEPHKVPNVDKFVAEIYNDKFIKAAVKG